MFRRMGIRMLASLAGIAAGIVLSDALLGGFSAGAGAVLAATVVFWVVHLIVSFLAVRVLVRNASIAVAGMLALASTVISLAVVNVIVSGLKISGAATYLEATVIIWITTTISIVVGGRQIRQR